MTRVDEIVANLWETPESKYPALKCNYVTDPVSDAAKLSDIEKLEKDR